VAPAEEGRIVADGVFPRGLHSARAHRRRSFCNQQAVYEILFRAIADTLLTIASDPQRLGVATGFFDVLHTWGHLHCVVPAGGLSPDHTRWIAGSRKFLLPVKVLSRLFRRLFLEASAKAYSAGKLQFFGDLQPLLDPQAFARYLAPLRKRKWVVYAKAPFGGPHHVLEYLGRYTHRVAISNHRLLTMENGQVSFEWKDYRDADRLKVMTVSAEEFNILFNTTIATAIADRPVENFEIFLLGGDSLRKSKNPNPPAE
jgi:hypothetical protein